MSRGVVRCPISVPLQGKRDAARVWREIALGTVLQNKTILVVEDEFFIAKEIQQALLHAGARIVGPVGDLSAGLALAETAALDLAVLDVNLNGTMDFAIADRLAARGIPYLFLTGYDGWALPERYRASPCVTKPFRVEQLVATVGQLCSPGAGQGLEAGEKA